MLTWQNPRYFASNLFNPAKSCQENRHEYVIQWHGCIVPVFIFSFWNALEVCTSLSKPFSKRLSNLFLELRKNAQMQTASHCCWRSLEFPAIMGSTPDIVPPQPTPGPGGVWMEWQLEKFTDFASNFTGWNFAQGTRLACYEKGGSFSFIVEVSGGTEQGSLDCSNLYLILFIDVNRRFTLPLLSSPPPKIFNAQKRSRIGNACTYFLSMFWEVQLKNLELLKGVEIRTSLQWLETNKINWGKKQNNKKTIFLQTAEVIPGSP